MSKKHTTVGTPWKGSKASRRRKSHGRGGNHGHRPGHDGGKKYGKKGNNHNDRLLTATLADVMQTLAVDAWDVVIVGDGSGTAWNEPCGWAAVLHDRESGLRQSFSGGMNRMTNGAAELLPYFHSLLWYVNGPGRRRLVARAAAGNAEPIRIHVITDAKVLVGQGNGTAARRENREMWLAVDAAVSSGYNLTWHWLARSRTALNRLTDQMARRSRLTLRDAAANMAHQAGRMNDGHRDIYDFNP